MSSNPFDPLTCIGINLHFFLDLFFLHMKQLTSLADSTRSLESLNLMFVSLINMRGHALSILVFRFAASFHDQSFLNILKALPALGLIAAGLSLAPRQYYCFYKLLQLAYL